MESLQSLITAIRSEASVSNAVPQETPKKMGTHSLMNDRPTSNMTVRSLLDVASRKPVNNTVPAMLASALDDNAYDFHQHPGHHPEGGSLTKELDKLDRLVGAAIAAPSTGAVLAQSTLPTLYPPSAVGYAWQDKRHVEAHESKAAPQVDFMPEALTTGRLFASLDRAAALLDAPLSSPLVSPGKVAGRSEDQARRYVSPGKVTSVYPPHVPAAVQAPTQITLLPEAGTAFQTKDVSIGPGLPASISRSGGSGRDGSVSTPALVAQLAQALKALQDSAKANTQLRTELEALKLAEKRKSAAGVEMARDVRRPPPALPVSAIDVALLATAVADALEARGIHRLGPPASDSLVTYDLNPDGSRSRAASTAVQDAPQHWPRERLARNEALTTPGPPAFNGSVRKPRPPRQQYQQPHVVVHRRGAAFGSSAPLSRTLTGVEKDGMAPKRIGPRTDAAPQGPVSPTGARISSVTAAKLSQRAVQENGSSNGASVPQQSSETKTLFDNVPIRNTTSSWYEQDAGATSAVMALPSKAKRSPHSSPTGTMPENLPSDVDADNTLFGQGRVYGGTTFVRDDAEFSWRLSNLISGQLSSERHEAIYNRDKPADAIISPAYSSRYSYLPKGNGAPWYASSDVVKAGLIVSSILEQRGALPPSARTTEQSMQYIPSIAQPDVTLADGGFAALSPERGHMLSWVTDQGGDLRTTLPMQLPSFALEPSRNDAHLSAQYQPAAETFSRNVARALAATSSPTQTLGSNPAYLERTNRDDEDDDVLRVAVLTASKASLLRPDELKKARAAASAHLSESAPTRVAGEVVSSAVEDMRLQWREQLMQPVREQERKVQEQQRSRSPSAVTTGSRAASPVGQGQWAAKQRGRFDADRAGQHRHVVDAKADRAGREAVRAMRGLDAMAVSASNALNASKKAHGKNRSDSAASSLHDAHVPSGAGLASEKTESWLRYFDQGPRSRTGQGREATVGSYSSTTSANDRRMVPHAMLAALNEEERIEEPEDEIGLLLSQATRSVGGGLRLDNINMSNALPPTDRVSLPASFRGKIVVASLSPSPGRPRGQPEVQPQALDHGSYELLAHMNSIQETLDHGTYDLPESTIGRAGSSCM